MDTSFAGLKEAFRSGMFRRDHNFSQEDIDFIRSLSLSKQDALAAGLKNFKEEYFCDFLALQLSRFRKKTKKMGLSDFLEVIDIDRLYSAMRGFLNALPRASELKIDPVVTNYIIPFDKSEQNSPKNFYQFSQYDRQIPSIQNSDDDSDEQKARNLILRSDQKDTRNLSGLVSIETEVSGMTKKTTIDLSKVKINYIYGDPFASGWWAAEPLNQAAAVLLGKNRFCISYFDEECNMWNRYARDGARTVFIANRSKSILDFESSSKVEYIVFTVNQDDTIREIRDKDNLQISLEKAKRLLNAVPEELFDAVGEKVYPLEFLFRMGIKIGAKFLPSMEGFRSLPPETAKEIYNDVVDSILRGKLKPFFSVVPRSFLVDLIYSIGKDAFYKPFEKNLSPEDSKILSTSMSYFYIYQRLLLKFKTLTRKTSNNYYRELALNVYISFLREMLQMNIYPEMFGGKILSLVCRVMLYSHNFIDIFVDVLEHFPKTTWISLRKIVTELVFGNKTFNNLFEITYKKGLLDFSTTEPSLVTPELMRDLILRTNLAPFSKEFVRDVIGQYIGNSYRITPTMSRVFNLILTAIAKDIPFDTKLLVHPAFLKYLKNRESFIFGPFIAFLEKKPQYADVLREYEKMGFLSSSERVSLARFTRLLRSRMTSSSSDFSLDDIVLPEDSRGRYFQIAVNYLTNDDAPESFKKVLARWLVTNGIKEFFLDSLPQGSTQKKEIEEVLVEYANF